MSNHSHQIVQKLWNYCNVLRDDLSACVHAQAGGMSYLLARRAQASGDYPSAKLRTGVEQLTSDLRQAVGARCRRFLGNLL